MGVAIELEIVVTGMSVSEEQAVSRNRSHEKSFERVLCPVRDNLEAKPPGIPFNSTSYQCLVSVLLFAEEALVDLDNAG